MLELAARWFQPVVYGSLRTRTPTLFLLIAVLLVNATGVNAGPVRLRVTPRAGFAPSDVIVYVSVDTDARNFALRVSAESESFFRSSEVPLAGERGPRVTVIHFREMPSGSYDVRADLIGSRGETRSVARTGLEII